jgi:hypothetical protein
MKPELHPDCDAYRIAALERAALPVHACAECERWAARLAQREGLLRTLPRVIAPTELDRRSERELEAEGRHARAIRALESLGRVEASAELDRAVEALASGVGMGAAARQRTPSVLDRLVAEELANPVKARVSRQIENLPRLAAPVALEQRLVRELAEPRPASSAFTAPRRARAWLAVAAAAVVLLALAPFALERRESSSGLQTARASRPFRVERLESTRDLSPSARAWLETVSSGMLAQNNI